jgi:hypothetical protein
VGLSLHGDDTLLHPVSWSYDPSSSVYRQSFAETSGSVFRRACTALGQHLPHHPACASSARTSVFRDSCEGLQNRRDARERADRSRLCTDRYAAASRKSAVCDRWCCVYAAPQCLTHSCTLTDYPCDTRVPIRYVNFHFFTSLRHSRQVICHREDY